MEIFLSKVTLKVYFTIKNKFHFVMFSLLKVDFDTKIHAKCMQEQSRNLTFARDFQKTSCVERALVMSHANTPSC